MPENWKEAACWKISLVFMFCFVVFFKLNGIEHRFRFKFELMLFPSPQPTSFNIAKVIVVGDVAVGKTCLISRWEQKHSDHLGDLPKFLPKNDSCLEPVSLERMSEFVLSSPARFRKGVFDKNYKATIGVDFEMERFEVLGVPFSLQLWVRRRCANLQTASNRVTRWLFLPIQRRLNNEYEENHMASSCLRSCSSRVALEFLNAAVTLVSESWIKWFAFIKLVFSARSSACLHLIQFLNVLKGFTVCAQADVHVNLHHSI